MGDNENQVVKIASDINEKEPDFFVVPVFR